MQVKNMYDPNFKRGIHLDFHTPELEFKTALKKFSARQWAQEMKQAHVQWATIFAKCHFGNTYYYTNIGHRHNDLKCDLMQEAADALQQEGIRVSVYYSLAWDKYAADKNPDWQQKLVDGSLVAENSPWGMLCINSPYMDELVIPQIKEMCAYQIDGIFIDIAMYQPDTCFCKYCQDKYRLEYGEELVKKDQVADPVKQKIFHSDSMLRALKRITKSAKILIADCEIVMNASHEIGQNLALLDENIVDITMIEAQGGSPHGGYNTIATQSRYARTLGKPFQIVNVRFHEGWGAMTMKPVEQMKYEFILAAAHEGQVICGDQVAWDGSLYPSVYKNIEKAFDFLEKRQDILVNFTSVKFAALLYGGNSPFPYSEDFPAPLMGGSKALTELHEQFDIINIAHLSKLNDYKLLLITTGTKLTETQAVQIKKFVELGGCLFIEHNAGINSESQQIIDMLSGCSFAGFSNYNCSYVEDPQASDFPLLITEAMLLLENKNATILKQAYNPISNHAPPYRAFRNLYPTPDFDSKQIGITINQPFANGGKVIRSAFPLFKVYWQENFCWIRKIIMEALDAFDLEHPYTVTAPSTVEFNLTENKNIQILHCINYHASKTSTSFYSNIEEVLPTNIKFKLPNSKLLDRIILKPNNTLIDFSNKDGYVYFSLSLSSVHFALELHYK